MGDVVHAGAHDEAERDVPYLAQRPERLAREVRGEGLALGVAVRLAVFSLDRRAHGDELGAVGAELVVVDVEANTDDAVGTELHRFFFHSRDGELTSGVHRRGELVELLARAPLPGLQADVVDRRAHDEAEWVKSGVFYEQELIDR